MPPTQAWPHERQAFPSQQEKAMALIRDYEDAYSSSRRTNFHDFRRENDRRRR